LAADLRLPIVVVAHNRLGCLNHIFLTTRAIETAGLTCAGVILNHLGEEKEIASRTNADVLRRCLAMPIEENFVAESVDISPSIREMLSALPLSRQSNGDRSVSLQNTNGWSISAPPS
jgi:dethiobiotin synthetase